MNERIRQLAEQAVEETQLLMIMEYRNFESTLYEKFAELIVRECSGIVQNYMSRWPEDHELTKQIKEHFGVEE
jgi:hypothetical protein